MSRAGHPGSGPEIRDLMSRTMKIWRSRSRMPGRGPGCPAGDPDVRPDGPDVRPDESRSRLGQKFLNWGRKLMIPRAKFDEILWMESGETWGYARSTLNQANPWIKINKISSHQQITKKICGYFWWGFLKLGKNTTKLG